MILTNTVQISTGDNKSNLYFSAKFHTDQLLITGKVPCDLSFYKSEIDKDAGLDAIYPVVNGSKVVSCEIQFTLTDIVKQSGTCTMVDVVIFFNSKVKAVLEATYPGWAITL